MPDLRVAIGVNLPTRRKAVSPLKALVEDNTDYSNSVMVILMINFNSPESGWGFCPAGWNSYDKQEIRAIAWQTTAQPRPDSV